MLGDACLRLPGNTGVECPVGTPHNIYVPLVLRVFRDDSDPRSSVLMHTNLSGSVAKKSESATMNGAPQKQNMIRQWDVCQLYRAFSRPHVVSLTGTTGEQPHAPSELITALAVTAATR